MKSKLAHAVAGIACALAPIAVFAQDAATVPGILPAFISAGSIDPNDAVPTTDKVPGSAIANLDIAFPLTVLQHGTRYVYSIALQDYNYTGSCVVSYELTQVRNGKTVVLDKATITTFNTSPGDVWFWVDTGKAIPDSPGEATLIGTVTYGTASVSTKATVVLQ